MQGLKSRTTQNALFVLVICVLVVESLFKGWFSFVAVPLLVAVVPMLAFCWLVARRQQAQGIAHRLVMPFIWAQVASILLFYVALPGFGDTEDVVLFGFWVVNVNSATGDLLVNIAQVVAHVGLALAVGFTVAVIWLLAFKKRSGQQ